MTNFYYDSDPVWRPRTNEFLLQRMEQLDKILDSEGWEHKPPGAHHMYREDDAFYLPYFEFKTHEDFYQRERERQKKAKRFIRYAKLFNRYQSQYCNLVGMIIN